MKTKKNDIDALISDLESSKNSCVSSIDKYLGYNGAINAESYAWSDQKPEYKVYHINDTDAASKLESIIGDIRESINAKWDSVTSNLNSLAISNEIMGGLCKEISKKFSTMSVDDMEVNSDAQKQIKKYLGIDVSSYIKNVGKDNDNSFAFVPDKENGLISIMNNGLIIGLEKYSDQSPIDDRIINAANYAIAMSYDPTVGYCQEHREEQDDYDKNRGGDDYDCSSLVFYSLLNGGKGKAPDGKNIDGILVGDINEPFVTADMADVFPAAGFEEGYVDYTASDFNLKPGDILWRNKHTEIYIGNGQTVGAHGAQPLDPSRVSSDPYGANDICYQDDGDVGDPNNRGEVSVVPIAGDFVKYYRYVGGK